MKSTLFIFAILAIFAPTVSFAAEFEEKLIMPDFLNERFDKLLNRTLFGYCDNHKNQPVFIEIYNEIIENGSNANQFTVFFKSKFIKNSFVMSIWTVATGVGMVYLDAEEDGSFEAIARMGDPEADNIVCRNYPIGKVK